MGEVYRARDTKLGRDVAIKILPEAFAGDPDRLGRFRREAQILASLNHPNIASIYGLEDIAPSDANAGTAAHALVMELVEGQTLAEHIARGPIVTADAVTLAKQIALALEAAHEQGIVHRDLKPANIKIRHDGTLKVLDFGLAKAWTADGGSSPRSASSSPTMLSPVLGPGASPALTQSGAVLGTAAYMSPEQARGRSVDRRADIWAFGCVLYEMLTGRTPFGGASVADALSSLVRDEPDWRRLSLDVGPRLRALIRRCLQKDPYLRLRDIGDGRLALDDVIATGDPDDGPPARAGESLEWAFVVTLPEGHWIPLDEAPVLALSADARVLVFVAASRDGRRLFRRDLARLTVTPIAGTDGASGPFLSPDAKWVGFFAAGWLKRVSIDGGVATSLSEASTLPRGACWTPDNRIIFAPVPDCPLMSIPDTGGVPQPLTQLDTTRNERSHRWPAILPDGRSVVFTIGSTTNSQDYDGGEIGVAALDTGQWRIVFRGARMARPAGANTLLVQRKSTLLHVSLGRADAAPVTSTMIEGIAGDASSGSAYFSTAGSVLAYAPVASVAERMSVWLVDRAGRASALPLPPRGFRYPRVSRDGRFIACHVADDRDLDARGTRGDIWILDLESHRLARVTMGGASTFPCWSPDGRSLAFFKFGSVGGIYTRAVSGARADTPLWATAQGAIRLPEAWHPDNSCLIVQGVEGASLLWRVPTGGGEVERLDFGPGHQWGASYSPDGRFLAYTTMESGMADVVVETMAGADRGRWQVSTDGGMFPVWSHDGREIVFVRGDTMMRVDVAIGDTFELGLPEPLFKCPVDLQTAPTRAFDLLPDGRFVMIGRAGDGGSRSEICVMAKA
jgi:serine/threonine-protein kinase